jgi:hypothetical protein
MEEDCIAISIVLLEIFEAVYRGFVTRNSLLHCNSFVSVGPEPYQQHLGIARKEARRGEEKVRRTYMLITTLE